MTGFAPKYDLFVFDWDGTVMDTTALIAKGIQHAAREMGYPVPSFQDACGVIGLDWRSAILKVVPDCPETEHMRFGEIYRAWYIPHEADVILFPGMRELIVGLHARGLRTAVATGKSREGLRRVFERTGLEGFFMTTQTASECLPKPNAEMLEKIGICSCRTNGHDRRYDPRRDHGAPLRLRCCGHDLRRIDASGPHRLEAYRALP